MSKRLVSGKIVGILGFNYSIRAIFLIKKESTRFYLFLIFVKVFFSYDKNYVFSIDPIVFPSINCRSRFVLLFFFFF